GLRLEGIRGTAPRPHPRSPAYRERKERILQTTLHVLPPGGGRWSTRSLARALKVSHMLVHRVWQTHGIGDSGLRAPREVGEKGPPNLDFVGLYARGPWKAFVFGTDVERPRFRVLVPLEGKPGHLAHRRGGCGPRIHGAFRRACWRPVGEASQILGRGFRGLEED
ncbi:transposase, partial [mine drainage metagenome]